MDLPADTRTLPLAPGTLIDGRYRLERHLASGGMGDVYRAEQVYMKRKVALKVMRPEWSRDPSMAARFQREAQLVSQLDHPHIVRVFDFGKTDGGQFFLTMELVEGQSLEAFLRRTPRLPPAQAVELLGQLLAALAEAHRRGIVHRDLKPDNVLLMPRADGGLLAKVLDFGIARLADPPPGSASGSPAVTQFGLVLGTPEYLSPEQALGQAVDRRADLYSLAVIAFRMLSGRLPFTGPSSQQFLSQHATVPAPLLLQSRPELAEHPTLAAAIQRGLAKSPAERFEDAAAMAAALGAPPVESTPLLAPTTLTRAASFAGGTLPGTTGGQGTLQARRRHQTQNLTVMLVDIPELGARAARLSRDAHQRLLELPMELLRPIFGGYRGRVIKTVQDAWLVTFASPTDALLCAMAALDRLAEHDAEAPPQAEDERLAARVAVTQGEVQVVHGEIFGDAVSLASRLQDVTPLGEIGFTEAVYLSMSRSEVRSTLDGSHEFKGVDVPVRIYRVHRDSSSPLPFGGLALEPLRPQLRRSANTLALRRHTGGFLRSLGASLSQGWDLWLDALAEGPAWRRTLALTVAAAGLVAFAGILTYGVRHRASLLPSQKLQTGRHPLTAPSPHQR